MNILYLLQDPEVIAAMVAKLHFGPAEVTGITSRVRVAGNDKTHLVRKVSTRNQGDWIITINEKFRRIVTLVEPVPNGQRFGYLLAQSDREVKILRVPIAFCERGEPVLESLEITGGDMVYYVTGDYATLFVASAMVTEIHGEQFKLQTALVVARGSQVPTDMATKLLAGPNQMIPALE